MCENVRYFCPEGTRFATEYPCPPGTYANESLTASEDNCIDAPAGWYVAGSANTIVTGRCELLVFAMHKALQMGPIC